MTDGVSYEPRPEHAFLAIHHSATPPTLDVGVEEIRQWHHQRGWIDIGYHFVIRRDGRCEVGRPLFAQGAHVRGFNDRAVGICLVGGVNSQGGVDNNFTAAQMSTLRHTINWLRTVYPAALVRGHKDFPGASTECPAFNVSEWYYGAGLAA